MHRCIKFAIVKPSEWNVLRRYDVTTYLQSLFSCIGASSFLLYNLVSRTCYDVTMLQPTVNPILSLAQVHADCM
jgi:hypothetical protein